MLQHGSAHLRINEPNLINCQKGQPLFAAGSIFLPHSELALMSTQSCHSMEQSLPRLPCPTLHLAINRTSLSILGRCTLINVLVLFCDDMALLIRGVGSLYAMCAYLRMNLSRGNTSWVTLYAHLIECVGGMIHHHFRRFAPVFF